jgi:putative acetyltransferase
MNYTLREIQQKDNHAVEQVIRSCLIEFNANHEGTAWTDSNLGCFSEAYNSPEKKYWVVTDAQGTILGGVGIAPLTGEESICELQKMYFLPKARGKGIAQQLLDLVLNYAKKYYRHCYLETLENMVGAQKFYEKNGFQRIDEALGQTQHFACDIHYIKNLV